MRGPLLLIVSCLLVVEVLPASGQAQLIEVGSRSARAPFGRVQRRGRLRDRFRSRFQVDETETEEETEPLQQRYPGAIEPPPVPPAGPSRSPGPYPSQSAASGPFGLQTSLILAEAELDRQLSTSSSGDAYRKHLRLGRLSELLLQNPGSSLTEHTRQQLQEVLDVYDRTRADPRQRWVSRLSGFRRIQAGLTQLLASAEEPHAPRPDTVSIDRKAAEPAPLRIPAGEPQPTQVLPSVRDSY